MTHSIDRDYSFEAAKKASVGIEYKGISDVLAEYLYQLANCVDEREVILEIGSYVGYSTVFLAYGSLAGYRAKVHCIDPWGLPASSPYSQEQYKKRLNIDDSTHKKFTSNIDKAGLAGHVAWHREYSHRFSSKWPRHRKIGLLFVDGDHSEWGAFADWYHYKKFLVDGATVVFHDYGHWAVKEAIKRIPKNQIGSPKIVGTGYQGNEAFVFCYRSGNNQPLIEWLQYVWLSLRSSSKS